MNGFFDILAVEVKWRDLSLREGAAICEACCQLLVKGRDRVTYGKPRTSQRIGYYANVTLDFQRRLTSIVSTHSIEDSVDVESRVEDECCVKDSVPHVTALREFRRISWEREWRRRRWERGIFLSVACVPAAGGLCVQLGHERVT